MKTKCYILFSLQIIPFLSVFSLFQVILSSIYFSILIILIVVLKIIYSNKSCCVPPLSILNGTGRFCIRTLMHRLMNLFLNLCFTYHCYR